MAEGQTRQGGEEDALPYLLMNPRGHRVGSKPIAEKAVTLYWMRSVVVSTTVCRTVRASSNLVVFAQNLTFPSLPCSGLRDNSHAISDGNARMLSMVRK